MKRIIFASLLLLSVIAGSSQNEIESRGFNKRNLFTGGDLQVSFSSGGTILGLGPVLGYSFNKYLDAGVLVNFTYTGYTDYSGNKLRQFDYGPGIFARVYPVNFLFAQANLEHNVISEKDIYASGGSNHYNYSSNSFLIGGGYCMGRQGQGSPFYYLSIMVDLTKDPNSPYVQVLGNGVVRAVPIIKGGIQIPLFQGTGRHRSRY